MGQWQVEILYNYSNNDVLLALNSEGSDSVIHSGTTSKHKQKVKYIASYHITLCDIAIGRKPQGSNCYSS